MTPSEAVRFVEHWTVAWNRADQAGLRQLFIGNARLAIQTSPVPASAPLVIRGRESICLYLECAPAMQDVSPMRTDHYAFDCVRPELTAWFTYGPGLGNGAARIEVTLDPELRIVNGALYVRHWPTDTDRAARLRLIASLEGIPMAGQEDVDC